MKLESLLGCSLLSFFLCSVLVSPSAAAEDLDYSIEVQTLFEHDDGKWLWFHPRAAFLPVAREGGGQRAILTLQKHLQHSDYYSGLAYCLTEDNGKTWTEPAAPRELAWRSEPDNVVVGVCDVTPRWHAPTGKVIALGVKVRYKEGNHLYDQPGSHDFAYAVYDPATDSWTDWRMVEFPDRPEDYHIVMPGCVQWWVEEDGTLRVPFYFRSLESVAHQVTVLECTFDGATIEPVRAGETLSLEVERGLVEPSLTKFGDRYYLTIRNDQKGYITSSQDALEWEDIVPWTFEDGSELGSYNTQQHWVTHSQGLYLVYTRRGANNDHIMRNRAPLFIAQVDPQKKVVLRETERVLIPERGAQMGNFGVATVSPDETWVTVSEGMWGEARARGAKGATLLARIRWNRPNGFFNQAVLGK
jgi:hypothetical protein